MFLGLLLLLTACGIHLTKATLLHPHLYFAVVQSELLGDLGLLKLRAGGSSKIVPGGTGQGSSKDAE